MTRQHFKKLADEMAAVRPDSMSDEYYVWFDCMRAIIKTCYSFNNSFDRDKFIAACKK